MQEEDEFLLEDPPIPKKFKKRRRPEVERGPDRGHRRKLREEAREEDDNTDMRRKG